MRQVSLSEIRQKAIEAKDTLQALAAAQGRTVKVYLHWTAAGYNDLFSDYHLLINGAGHIFLSTGNLAYILAHTYKRNSGSIGIALCCCADQPGQYVGQTDLGPYPPTDVQIDTMAQVIAVLAEVLDLDVVKDNIMTHGEAADNEDGLDPGYQPYAWWSYPQPDDGDTRGDLEYLGTSESPSYNPGALNGSRGGDILRGKAIWFMHYPTSDMLA